MDWWYGFSWSQDFCNVLNSFQVFWIYKDLYRTYSYFTQTISVYNFFSDLQGSGGNPGNPGHLHEKQRKYQEYIWVFPKIGEIRFGGFTPIFGNIHINKCCFCVTYWPFLCSPESWKSRWLILSNPDPIPFHGAFSNVPGWFGNHWQWRCLW